MGDPKLWNLKKNLDISKYSN